MSSLMTCVNALNAVSKFSCVIRIFSFSASSASAFSLVNDEGSDRVRQDAVALADLNTVSMENLVKEKSESLQLCAATEPVDSREARKVNVEAGLNSTEVDTHLPTNAVAAAAKVPLIDSIHPPNKPSTCK